MTNTLELMTGLTCKKDKAGKDIEGSQVVYLKGECETGSFIVEITRAHLNRLLSQARDNPPGKIEVTSIMIRGTLAEVIKGVLNEPNRPK